MNRNFLLLCTLAVIVLVFLNVDVRNMDYAQAIVLQNQPQQPPSQTKEKQVLRKRGKKLRRTKSPTSYPTKRSAKTLSIAAGVTTAAPTSDPYDEDDDDDESEEEEGQSDTSYNDEISDPSLLAPRSYNGTYNEYLPGNKYLIYSPSGGFSNQRKEIEYAIVIGQLLNRTVYVPMCARHTNNWDKYIVLKGDADLFPMDRIIDFPFLSNRIVPINITLREMVNTFDKEDVAEVNRYVTLYERRDVLSTFGAITKPLLYFHGKGFYHPWFSEDTMRPVRKQMRFTQYLRQLAVGIANEAFNGSAYNAMHIRMGDYSWHRTGDGYSYYRTARDLKWNLRLPTYIATEPDRDERYFRPLVEKLNVMFSNNLPRKLVTQFTHAFPPGRIRGDMLGLLELLICAQATSFQGTYFSTFSKYIYYIRSNRANLFPEILNTVDASGDVDAKEEADEDGNE